MSSTGLGLRERRWAGRWLGVAGPALLVTVPLAGLAIRPGALPGVFGDAETQTATTNPFSAAKQAVQATGEQLDVGSFAPLGRFVDYLVHGLALDAGEALSLAPHAVLGVVRLVMVALLALLAYRMVAGLSRSAELDRTSATLARLFPLALAAALVANGTAGSLATAPQTALGAVAVILAASLATARDRDMAARPVAWHEYLALAALGAAAAAFDELAYLAPFVAASYWAARSAAAGLPARTALRTAAGHRWLALTVGFAAVFVPARVLIEQRCAETSACGDVWLPGYLPTEFLSATAARLVSGLPPAGWAANAERAGDTGVQAGLAQVLGNSLLVAVALGLLCLAIVAAVRARRQKPEHHSPGRTTSAEARFALALAALGTLIAASAALWAGLASTTQRLSFGQSARHGWRDTVLTQVGWALVATAVLVAAIASARRWRWTRLLASVAPLALAGAAAVSLVANWQLAEVDRHRAATSASSLISAATVNDGRAANPAAIAELNDWPVITDIDYPGPPNAIRCELLELFEEANPSATPASAGLATQLDRFMAERHEIPFCDPARTPGTRDAS